jgi:hypothetical protein
VKYFIPDPAEEGDGYQRSGRCCGRRSTECVWRRSRSAGAEALCEVVRYDRAFQNLGNMLQLLQRNQNANQTLAFL